MAARLSPIAAPFLIILLYLGICFSFSYGTAGLEEDEAISFQGAATLAEHVSAPCRKGEDIGVPGACLPVMVAPYVGAPKDYFLLPFFLIFGVHTWVARMGAAVLAAVGILGCWVFLKRLFGPLPASVTAGFLALNPSYIDAPVFDQGNIAFSLGAFGLILIAISNVMDAATRLRVFLLGFAVGLGVWGRLNFAWLVFAGVVAAAAVYRSQLRCVLRFFPFMMAGCLTGAAPLLGYLAFRGRNVAAVVQAYANSQSLSQRAASTLSSLKDVLLASSEHREGIWHGGTISAVTTFIMAILVVLAFAWCLFKGGKAGRAIAFCSGLLLLIYLSSSLPVSEHHLVIFVILAALSIGIAFSNLWTGHGLQRTAVVLLCCAYVATAARIDAESGKSLHETGGYGEWSSGINSLAGLLESSQAGSKHLYALDWGFSNPLFVLTNGRLRAQELFWNPSDYVAAPGVTWAKVIGDGGTFVTYAQENLHFPEATIYFENMLARSGVAFRKIQLQQRDKSAYAEVFIVPRSPAGLALANTSASSDATTFRALPATVRADANGHGSTSLMFWTKKSHLVEIHVGAPDGPLLSRFSSGQRAENSGIANTGDWVTNGMVFYLQDVAGKPLTAENTLASVRVEVGH